MCRAVVPSGLHWDILIFIKIDSRCCTSEQFSANLRKLGIISNSCQIFFKFQNSCHIYRLFVGRFMNFVHTFTFGATSYCQSFPPVCPPPPPKRKGSRGQSVSRNTCCKLLTVRDVHFEAVAWTSQQGFLLPYSTDCCLHHCCPNGYCRLPSSCCRHHGCPSDDSRLGCCPICCFVCQYSRNSFELLFITVIFSKKLCRTNI